MEYIISLLVLAGLYAILSSSFSLIVGYGGLMSVAHPIFFAFGAYTTGMLAIHTQLNPVLVVLAGGAVPMFASVMISLPSLRVSGDYLLITSLGFQLGFIEIIKNTDALGGGSGLTNIPDVFTGTASRSGVFALITWATALAVVLTVRWIVKGPYGRTITAMRDDETAFAAIGRNAMRIKMSIFAIGSGMAGLAGGIYAYYYQYLTPEKFGVTETMAILTMVVVGGMVSVWGPILGAILVLGLPQVIVFINLPDGIMASLQSMIFSALVLIFLFLRPQGLIGVDKFHITEEQQ